MSASGPSSPLVLPSGDYFLQFFFSKKFFREYHQSVKAFGSKAGPNFVRPDLGLSLLQR